MKITLIITTPITRVLIPLILLEGELGELIERFGAVRQVQIKDGSVALSEYDIKPVLLRTLLISCVFVHRRPFTANQSNWQRAISAIWRSLKNSNRQ